MEAVGLLLLLLPSGKAYLDILMQVPVSESLPAVFWLGSTISPAIPSLHDPPLRDLEPGGCLTCKTA